MDGVLLIGLGDGTSSARAALGVRLGDEFIHSTETLPSNDLDLVKLVGSRAVALVSASSWQVWTKRVPLTHRPHTFVIVEADPVNFADQEGYLREGAVGCAPVNGVAWLVDDIVRLLEVLRAGEKEEVAFSLGERATVSSGEGLLVGWGAGPLAHTFASVRAVVERLQPLLPSGRSPFEHLSPSEWLDLYAQAELGMDLLGDKKAEELKKKLGKLKVSLEGFPRHFRDTLMSESPGARPHAVLVLGETGTGKTLVVDRLHRALEEKTGAGELPKHRVNCSTLGEMAEVELFGALRGAYTPLSYTNPGAILRSFGGTLFLDEFAALSPQAQAKLLLFLEDGTLKPMAWPGEALRVPVLIVAATNARLEDLSRRGLFRSDLFHRFRDGRIELPALRETKPRDLPYMVDYLLQTDPSNAITPKAGATAKVEARESTRLRVRHVGSGALNRLQAHDYPGNVRELQTVLAQAIDRAAARRSDVLASSDIVFGESTLPRQDSVVAIITREAEGAMEVLLRMNPHWTKWFLPGGRVQHGETYEACLIRELQEKLGVAAGRDYESAPFDDVSPIRLIQYSSRDPQYKQYHFFAYRVTLTAEAGKAFSRPAGHLKWQRLADLRRSANQPATNEGLSETLLQFERVWVRLATAEKVAG